MAHDEAFSKKMIQSLQLGSVGTEWGQEHRACMIVIMTGKVCCRDLGSLKPIE